MKSYTHAIPRSHLQDYEAIAETFECGLDINAPEDYPEKDALLTWVVPNDEIAWIENALVATSREQNLSLPEFEWQDVATNIDWQAKVAADFPPLVMGSFYITRNNEAIPNGSIGLAIPPNQAFGSGEHATTASCLALFEHIYMNPNTPTQPPRNTLDMGAGSGLLAIGAAKIFPHSTHVATDIDADSVRICAENCSVNDVPEVICAMGDGFELDAVQDNAPFDLIFANILMNPLLNMAEDLVSALAENGVAILSGFTPEQFPTITETYTNLGLTPITHTEREQTTSSQGNIPSMWVAAAFRKNS